MFPSATVELSPAVRPPYVGRASNLSAGGDKLVGVDREVGARTTYVERAARELATIG